MADRKFKVLFVCLGNICRSPLAEAVFRHLAEGRGFGMHIQAESCGTGGWHVGEPAHSGSRAVAMRHGVSLDGHCARQLRTADFTDFDLILAMDRANLEDLKRAAPKAASAEVRCFREFDGIADCLDVPDPYYGGRETFEEVYRIAERASEKILDYVLAQLTEADR